MVGRGISIAVVIHSFDPTLLSPSLSGRLIDVGYGMD